jgi:hypothetical protein
MIKLEYRAADLVKPLKVNAAKSTLLEPQETEVLMQWGDRSKFMHNQSETSETLGGLEG